jgi:multidrug efflux pump subunit AcrB
MKSFFSLLTRLSLRFRIVTLALVLVFSSLGIIAITQLKQELVPSIAFPQTIILAQVSGMTSDQVLNIITKRMEAALKQVPPVVNLESTTTSAVGSVIIARNNFGLNQQKVQADIQAALDSVWLPQRRIQPTEGENGKAFAAALLNDVTPDVLLYLQSKDPNFLFQLSPEVWRALPADTVKTTLGYLANQQETTDASKNALRNLIDKEVVPQLDALGVVARVQINGGQALPGEQQTSIPAADTSSAPTSLLLKLSPEAWAAVSEKLGGLGAQDANAVKTLSSANADVPKTPPALPKSWQMDHFSDASDLLEMRAAARTIAAVFNTFHDTGRIVGALGQTNDLTPEVVKQMLQIDPSMASYFKAEQLVALPKEVFDALPEDYINGLDGFTRDELAAAKLAESISGQVVEPRPVDLPNPWRIQPPQLISFSFDDIPLASFSVFSTGAPVEQSGNNASGQPALQTTASSNNNQTVSGSTQQPVVDTSKLPEGPALPKDFSSLNLFFVGELNTADDLFRLQLSPTMAQFGGGGDNTLLDPATFFNTLVLIDSIDINTLPAAARLLAGPLLANFDAQKLISQVGPEAIQYVIQHQPGFISKLSAGVFDDFSDDVLKLPEVTPPLADAWNTLAGRPQFQDKPLHTAADVLALGGGQASKVLNTINQDVPERFAGYEVRLFDSLSTGTARYFALNEPNFYKNLDADVLKKLSPAVLKLLPADMLSGLDKGTADTLTAIAGGKQDSAARQLAARYTSDVPPADPSAPAINSEWGLLGNFFNIELNSADDFFRFPSSLPFKTPADFMNSIFNSPQGTAFAPNLFGKLTPDAVNYMLKRDPKIFDGLKPEGLRLMPEEVLKRLPADVQERAKSDGEVFTPTTAVTRTNGNSSLVVTVYKKRDANTVEAFHKVQDKLDEINAKNPSIRTTVAFEQASFIEESISGVAREGGLGGIFAIIIILVFLSSGVWPVSPRRIAGAVIVAVSLVLLALLTLPNLSAAGGDFSAAFAQVDTIVRVVLILGVIAGIAIMFWPRSLPNPAWRSTLVVAVSIPLSLLMALAFMNWVPPIVHQLLAPGAETSPILAFIIRLFPESITLNIMTLSGLTVAIGRVVDDSIVVLENIFRQIQEGGDKREAIISGTRDVSVAIFAATLITVVVFLPLGLTGGLISEFFLPFGLAVTYSLLSSFIVAITVVPVMAFLFLHREDLGEASNSAMERAYLPVLKWALANNRNKLVVLLVAGVSLVIGGALFATRPTTFLPGFGEPQISVSVNMPAGTKIVDTNSKVLELEKYLQSQIPKDQLKTVATTVGSGGASLASLLGGGNSVSENIASITIRINVSEKELDDWAAKIRSQSETIFGKENVKVSAATLSDQGFGGFALVLSGPQNELEAINQEVIDTLNDIPGLTNASSNLAQIAQAGGSSATTYIRIDGESAVRFTGELETQNTLGVTQEAMDAIKALPDLPPGVKVSQGFESQLQTEGFKGVGVAMVLALLIVVLLLMVTFGSVVHWLDIILSVMVAPVGAAVALTLTNSVLGISALIGLLMLIGIVVTNAVVLIDRVQANRRERGMSVHDALIEAGDRRLRPILMTAIATIFALMPLAIGLSKGAIIASELGRVVIGGLFSSTLLTLIVVPVAYSLLSPVHKAVVRVFRRREPEKQLEHST